MSGIAGRIARTLEPLVGGNLPVRLTAWDGSAAGPQDAPLVRLNSPNVLRRMLWAPGELGAAQAYVTGELEVEGDLVAALRHAWSVVSERDLSGVRVTPRLLASVASLAKDAGVIGRRPSVPDSQVVVRGRLHSRARDEQVIAHHYDITSAFYEAVLDENMAYSCAYVTGADVTGGETETYRLEDAQRDKLDLVCRKLGLDQRPGQTLLDVGCGWGSLSLYAARTYGARVTGATIAAEQKAFIDRRVALEGLDRLVTIRLQDYRDIDCGPFDAVASLEMGEHAGDRGYPAFVDTLRRNVSEHGRVLVQQMSRGGRHPGGGPFIESFITPDMTMRPVGETVALLEKGGLEVRDVQALREHYAWTARAWMTRFEANKEKLRELVGDEQVRVWELYLAGGQLAFEQGRMGVDQILAVRRGGTTPPRTPR
ncbi:class I SAM-dependent methyltransferase [Branchiibius cervicis]|uniref:Class I SAM-dependent methyltransferase n=1 Tax=Branchiibius cervicis TaxID=908252 RepID=A0ABW2AR06_9MICO